MKKLTTPVVLILVFVLGYFVYQYQQKNSYQKQVEANQVRDQQRAEAREELLEPIREAEKQKGEKLSLDEALAKLPIAERSHYTLGFKAGLEDIRFYGQVIDQYGEPVVGAQVEVSIGGRFLASGQGSGTFTTDDEGRFQVDQAKGGSLRIRSILHSSIQYKNPLGKNGEPRGLSFWGYQHTEGGDHPLWTDTSENNPYVFKTWRIERYEQLLSGGNHVAIEPDERLYTLDLLDKWGKRALKEGEYEGQFRIKHYRQPGEEKTDWWFEIEAIDGGLMLTDDPYMNLAPTQGYQSTPFRIEQSTTKPDYKERVNYQRLYFTTNNGSEYGSIEFSISTRGNDVTSLRYKYKLNPNGSRNLALKE